MDDAINAQEAQQHYTRLSYLNTHYTCSKYLAALDITLTIIISIVAWSEPANQLRTFCWVLPARWLIKLPILKLRVNRYSNHQSIHRLDFALNALEVVCWIFCVWIFFILLQNGPELKKEQPIYYGFSIYQLTMFLFIICFPLVLCLVCPILLLLFLPFVMLIYKCLPGPGASDSELEAIPCYTIGEADATPTREESCAICMTDYETAEEYRVLPCGHDFHKACIDQWLKKKALCPLCRTWINRERIEQNAIIPIHDLPQPQEF